MKHLFYLSIVLSVLLQMKQCNTKPTDAFEIKPSSRDIQQGQEVTITWAVLDKRANFVKIDKFEEEFPLVGQIVVVPDTTIVYKFSADIKGEKPITKRCKINVSVPAIERFEVSPKVTTDEGFVDIRWSVQAAKNIIIEGLEDKITRKLETQDFMKVKLDSSMSLRLIAKNDFGTAVTKSVWVDVQLIENLDSILEIYKGDSAWVKWKFKKCKYVTIDTLPRRYNPIDSILLKPDNTTMILFNLQNQFGETTRNKDATIKVLPPSILFFSGPKVIALGDEAKLTWSVKGVKKVAIKIASTGKDITPDSLPANGKIMVKPIKTESYKLIMQYGGQVKYKTITISVREQRPMVNKKSSITAMKGKGRLNCEIFAMDNKGFPNLKMQVLMVDDQGNFISNLAPPFAKPTMPKQYFKLLAEHLSGKRIPIQEFNVTEVHNIIPVPYDIALALDYSGSMGELIDTLELAVKNFVKNKPDDDRLSLTTFDDTVQIVVPLTRSRDSILKKAAFGGNFRKLGNTALYAGADLALTTLDGSTNTKILVLFADGHDNASFLLGAEGRAFTAMQLIKKARAKNVRIHVIAYGDEINNPLLERVARYTGGNVYNINEPHDIGPIFLELQYILRNYYEIECKLAPDSGMRSMNISFNSIFNPNAQTSAELFIGEDYDVTKYEYISDAYWTKYADTIKKRALLPVAAPQSAAFFDFDRSELTEEYKPHLRIYANYLKDHSKAEIIIFGHTDSKGSDQYCMDLSRKRAKMVKDYIIQQGIPDRRIRIEGFGKLYPIWESEEVDWKAHENRRVEILLME